MLKKIDKKGFTIIEVLIVLAIAGLILLVVFLAVPALQRNSRNTALKNDVNNLAGGISEYRANNNGKTPAAICGTGDITLGQGSCPNPSAPTQVTKIQGSTAVTAVATSGTGPAAAVLTPGTIQVDIGKKCATGFAVADGATSARTISIYYVIETSGSPSFQCLET